MPLTRTDATVVPYVRQNPGDTNQLALYTLSELRRVETTLSQIATIVPQVYVAEPKVKLNGMIVTNKAPWNPLGTGDGLARYNGTAWVAVGGAGGGDMTLAATQTNSGVKTFLDTTLALRNVANTFSGTFTNTITANRVYTLKDASGTLAFITDITGTNSGVNTGDQTITLTSDVTGSGTGSFVTTIAANVVTLAKLNTEVLARMMTLTSLRI